MEDEEKLRLLLLVLPAPYPHQSQEILEGEELMDPEDNLRGARPYILFDEGKVYLDQLYDGRGLRTARLR